jgi:hypothetical protein
VKDDKSELPNKINNLHTRLTAYSTDISDLEWLVDLISNKYVIESFTRRNDILFSKRRPLHNIQQTRSTVKTSLTEVWRRIIESRDHHIGSIKLRKRFLP